MPGPLSCYVKGSKRVKEGGGCGRKLLKCEKDTEGCVWVCVLGGYGLPHDNQPSLVSLYGP